MRAILLAMFPKIWISAWTWTVYSIKAKRAVCKIILTRNVNLTNYIVLNIDVHTSFWFFLLITSLFRLYYYVNAGTHEECTIYYKPMHVLFISIQWQSSWHPSLAFLFRNINGKLINDINKEDSKLTKLTENIHYLQKWVKRRKSPENTFNSAGLWNSYWHNSCIFLDILFLFVHRNKTLRKCMLDLPRAV